MRLFIVSLCFFAALSAYSSENYFFSEGDFTIRNSGELKYFGLGMPCKSFATIKQCQNKRVCRVVCAAAPTGVGAAICNEVCDFVPECSNIVVCAEYY